MLLAGPRLTSNLATPHPDGLIGRMSANSTASFQSLARGASPRYSPKDHATHRRRPPAATDLNRQLQALCIKDRTVSAHQCEICKKDFDESALRSWTQRHPRRTF